MFQSNVLPMGENGVEQESQVNQNGYSWWGEQDTWDWQDQFTWEAPVSRGSQVKEEYEDENDTNGGWHASGAWHSWANSDSAASMFQSNALPMPGENGAEQESEVNQNGYSWWEEHYTWDWQDQSTWEASQSLGSQVKEEYEDENDTNGENGGWHASGAWHAWANSDSELQGVKADVKTEDEFGEEKSNRKGKRPLTDEKALEASKGMRLDGAHPKERVNTFLSRYFGRSMVKGQDISYETKSVQQGFVSKLVVSVWSHSQSYFGQARETEKAAEVSAAEAFLVDQDVIEAANHLPPPMSKVRQFERDKQKGMVQSLSGFKKTKAVRQIKQAAHDTYNQFRDDGCGTAMWDGVAWCSKYSSCAVHVAKTAEHGELLICYKHFSGWVSSIVWFGHVMVSEVGSWWKGFTLSRLC